MDLQKSLKQAWEILTLKQPVMQAVAKDPGALNPALAILAGASILVALGGFLFPARIGMVSYSSDIVDVVVQAAVSIVFGVAILYTTGYLAEQVFHSKLAMNEYVRVMGHASLVNVLGIFSPLTFIAGVWSLVVLCTVLNKIGKMQAGSIILLILLEALVIGALTMALTFMGTGYGFSFDGMMY